MKRSSVESAADLDHWRRVAIEATHAGGEEVRRRFGTGLDARAKRGADLVTTADLAAEERILAMLREAEPSFGIVSEEAGACDAAADYVWMVDPLDGTNNFAMDHPYVGVAVTLLHRGTPIVAATHNPLVGTTWSAVVGGGAFRDGAPIRVNPTRPPERAVVALVVGYPVEAERAARIHRTLASRVKRVLANWAPALDWCLLAHGGIDALVSLDSEPEDQLGGALIAAEAGALLSDFAGHPATPTAPRLIAAASRSMQERLVETLRPDG